MTTVDPRVFVHDPDFLRDEIEADSMHRPIPCIACGRTDLPAWHRAVVDDGERGVCDRCEHERCYFCRRLTGDGADREPYVLVEVEGRTRAVCERCYGRGVEIPVSYEEDVA